MWGRRRKPQQVILELNLNEEVKEMFEQIIEQIKRAVAEIKARRDAAEAKVTATELAQAKLEALFESIKPPAPVISSLVATPATAAGDGAEQVTLAIAVAGHVDSVSIDQGVGAVTLSDGAGSVVVTGSAPGTVTYTATAVGLGGQAEQAVEVVYT